MSCVLSLRGISKRFGAVEALAGVDLDVQRGTVHAVLGENGAGKSTLMRVIYGLVAPDSGTLSLDGAAVRFSSALDARRAGIGMVHQEFALIDALSVTENLALALSPPGERRWRPDRVAAAARRLAGEIGLELGDLDAPVGSLPVGQRQRIEIVKALAGNTRVLILDEPTAVLTPAEVTHLFAVLDRLRDQGTAVLFITHRLAEVTLLADTVTVMRRGRVVAQVGRAEADAARLAQLMVGTLASGDEGAGAGVRGAEQLRVADLVVGTPGASPALDGVSLTVHGGEIVGIAGVDGNGQTELFEALTGVRVPLRGAMWIGGAPLPPGTPAAAIAGGLACIPPDRQRDGVVAEMTVAENAVLNVRLLRAHGALLRPAAQRATARALIDAYQIRTGGLDVPARSLSGGNLQKLIVGRALVTTPRVLVAVNPTRGLDVAAAAAVYAALRAALARGAGVLLIASDLDEIVAHAHRVAVLFRGRLGPWLERPLPVERLGAMLAGSEVA